MEQLTASALRYPDCWAPFTDCPIIDRWNLDTDKDPLFREAMRALSPTAAVYELTGGDESVAELLLPLPVNEITHAILDQSNVIQTRLGASTQ